MIFNSLQYGIFLSIVFLIYWTISHRYRWILLWIASYYFYMSWNAKYIVLIFVTTLISYTAALMLEKFPQKNKRKQILGGTLLVCLGILFVFKYFNFCSSSLNTLLECMAIKAQPITLKLLLPVGISFYTFQTISYVIDVYRGKITAEHNFGIYATYISFFPQLVAGPIERTDHLLPQIKSEKKFDYNLATYGLKLMAWGLFKKIIIADTLATYVDGIFNDPMEHTGFSLVLATFFFSIQIYCDFSGYSDIAIGSANLLGIKLMRNFISPYFSESLKEFWSRWHISLSTWFKDYVYFSLGGNRVSKIRHKMNLVITFLLSGLWHGANWTYIFWGGVHGIAQALEATLKKRQKNKYWFEKYFKRGIIFAFCTVAWIFFRANTISDGVYIVFHMLDGVGQFKTYIRTGLIDFRMGSMKLLEMGMFISGLAIYDLFSLKMDVIEYVSSKNRAVRYTCYMILILVLIIFRVHDNVQFVYFQF